MKFSFLLCVNKDTGFLGSAIDSVLQQDDPDFDFYIIANNCSDALWSMLTHIQDPRLNIYRTRIGQLSFNLNYGINLIEDGYILRMDADDICLPNRLTLTKKYLTTHNWPDIIGGQSILIDGEGKEIGRFTPPVTNKTIRACLWWKNPFSHPSCAIRLNTVRKLRGYSGGFMSEDYDLWLRAARDKNIIFGNIDEPLIKYRIHDHQTRMNPLGYAEVAGYMLREHLLGMGFKYFMASIIGIIKLFIRTKS